MELVSILHHTSMLAMLTPQMARHGWSTSRKNKEEDSGRSQEKLGLLGGPSRDVSIETISMSVSNSNAAENSQIAQPEIQRKTVGPKIREKDEVMFCSPFRRRRKKTESYLTREEAWEMYLAKMEEEANYFTVTENDAPDNDADICTCQTCIASYESLYNSYLSSSNNIETTGDNVRDNTADQADKTAEIMQAILQEESCRRTCAIM